MAQNGFNCRNSSDFNSVVEELLRNNSEMQKTIFDLQFKVSECHLTGTDLYLEGFWCTDLYVKGRSTALSSTCLRERHPLSFGLIACGVPIIPRFWTEVPNQPLFHTKNKQWPLSVGRVVFRQRFLNYQVSNNY